MFSFDYFNQINLPNISLCNPNGDVLYSLGTISDRKLNLRFNALSEFSFVAPRIVDGIVSDYWELLDYRRLINIENIGLFMITEMEINNDGVIEEKIISAKSIEVELSFKKLTLFKGQYALWDVITPAQSLLGKLLVYLPGWSVVHVDAELAVLQRSFDVSDMTIYSFLMNDVSQAFQAIFTFDIINKTITAKTVANSTILTDIYLSYDNLVENTNIKELSDELVTALNVIGGGNLSISLVNPLGTDTIYNFNYYKNLNWMTQDLIDAINAWEAKIAANQGTYATNFASWNNYNVVLLQQQAQLATLEGEMTALKSLQKVRVQQGNMDLTTLNAQIRAKQLEIDAVKVAIVATQASMTSIETILKNIHDLVDITSLSNFTALQQIELSNLIIGSTYNNPNFIQTDIMSASAVQEQAQGLYNSASAVLTKISEPRYTFDINAINFVFLKEFQTFISQLVLGAVVTIEFSDGQYTSPALLGMDLDLDDPTQFKIIFSNRLRLDDAAFQFSDLFNQSINSGIDTTFNSELWTSQSNYTKNDVSKFITSALNAAKNAVTSGSNQEFLIDANGLRGRYLDPATGAYASEELWVINNMLAFTDDNWDHAKLAIGKILTPSGTYGYGVVGEYIIGNIIAGEKLIIQNDNLSFIVNGSGAYLRNAVLDISSDNHAQILLDPKEGISISQYSTSGSLSKNFYIDNNGNIVFTGKLKGGSGDFTGEIIANSGKIGMWNIDQYGLYDDSNDNYIYGDGRIRLGMLEIAGDEAWFHGNIYAENINNYIQGRQIRNIIADTITAGTIRGIDIYGCRIHWPGATLESGGYGIAAINSTNVLSLSSGAYNSNLTLTTKAVLESTEQTIIGNLFLGRTTLQGSLETVDIDGNFGWGKTENIIVSTTNGSQLLSFVNGLLVDPSHYQGGGSGSWTSGSSSGSTISGSLVWDFTTDEQGWTPTHYTTIAPNRTWGSGGLQIINFLGQNGTWGWKVNIASLGLVVGAYTWSVHAHFEISSGGLSENLFAVTQIYYTDGSTNGLYAMGVSKTSAGNENGAWDYDMLFGEDVVGKTVDYIVFDVSYYGYGAANNSICRLKYFEIIQG